MLIEVATVEPAAILVQRAANGDGRAFDELVREYRPWLLGLCFRLLRDREAAEDTVQEALASAFVNLHRLQDPARFRAWLSRITLNACRMHLRRAAAMPECDRSADLMLIPTPDRDPGLITLEDALAQLDRETRLLLSLCYDEGLSHAELAALLSLSRAAIKSRLHRAREQLRKEMLKTMTPQQKAILGVSEEAPWKLRTILLVEPDLSLQATIRDGLTTAGYKVITLPSGQAALEAASARRGQMLILDKHCGESHWIEVLTLLKTDAWARENVPVAVIVDPDNQRDVFLAWGAGAAICLTRPPAITELVGFAQKLEHLWPEELRPEPWPEA